ncbi:MAG: PQQ-like beta-propeller repeat protein [candidate division WOR-3 bacterium]|nr:MAG: PQQ-like beta-propeller repeat protein [candidate division WOR-3 bacterium]
MKKLTTMAAVSTAVLVLVAGCGLFGGNKKPNTPSTPHGPSQGIVFSFYRFRTATTDPEGDSVSYMFDWGDGDTSDWSGFMPGGDTVEKTHAWTTGGAYPVKVKAKDVFGNLSDWSPSRQMDVSDNRPPYTAAKPEGPTDTVPAAVTFTSYASDPDGEQVSIRFLWGDGDTSDWSDFVAGATRVSMSHFYAEFGSYFVQAQARDTNGVKSGWSAQHTLNIGRLRWSFDTEDLAFAPVLAADGNVIVVSRGRVTAVSPTGDAVWWWLLPEDTVATSAPAVGDDGTLYFGVNGALRAAAATDAGWLYPVAGLVVTTPALAADGSIIFGTTADSMFCLNRDGTLKWVFETEGEVKSSPAIGTDGTVYFGCNDNHFYALNPDGTLKWRYSTGRYDNESSPAIGADGTVYFGSDDNHVHALEPDGTPKWKFRTDWLKVEASPVIDEDGTVYCGSADSHLYAIEPDGSESWRFQTFGEVKAAAAIDRDNNIILASPDGRLYVLYPDAALRWSQELGDAIDQSPVVAEDGTIYVVTTDGKLHSLLGHKGLADSPWPMYHHDPQHTGRARGW